MNGDVEVLTVLFAILDELKGLRADQRAREHAPSTLTRDDRERLARLLPAIAGCYGSEPFSSRDVVEDERPGLMVVRNGLTPKALSKLFARALDTPIDGHIVQRVGLECGITSWRVVVTNRFQSLQGTAQSGSMVVGELK